MSHPRIERYVSDAEAYVLAVNGVKIIGKRNFRTSRRHIGCKQIHEPTNEKDGHIGISSNIRFPANVQN